MDQEKEKLIEFKKDCLLQEYQTALEWDTQANQHSLQFRKWCVTFWLIYIGLLIKKDWYTTITITHMVVGILGIFFFWVLNLITDRRQWRVVAAGVRAGRVGGGDFPGWRKSTSAFKGWCRGLSTGRTIVPPICIRPTKSRTG